MIQTVPSFTLCVFLFIASIEPGKEYLASSSIKQLRKSYGHPFRSSELPASLVQLSKSASDTHERKNGENSTLDKQIYKSFPHSKKQKITEKSPATMVFHQELGLGLLPVPRTEAHLEYSSVSLLGLEVAASTAVVNTCGEAVSKQFPLELFRQVGRARRQRKRRHRQRIMKAVGAKSSKEASQLQETENASSQSNPDNRSQGQLKEGRQTKKKQPLVISPEKGQEVINSRAEELPNNLLINEEYRDVKNQGEACISSLARSSLKETASFSNSELSNDENQLDCIGSSHQSSQILHRRETGPLHSCRTDSAQHQGCRKQLFHHNRPENDVSCKSRQEIAASSRTADSGMTLQSLGCEMLEIPLASLPAYRTEREIRLEGNKRPSVNSSYASGLGLANNYGHAHRRHKSRQNNKNRFTTLYHGKHRGVAVDRQNIKHHLEPCRHDKGQDRGEGAGQREKHSKNHRSKKPSYIIERRERFSRDFKNSSKERSCSSVEKKSQRSDDASLENFSSVESDTHQNQNSKGGNKYSTMDSLRDSHDEIKCSKSGLFSSSKECQHLHAIGCALCKHEQGTVDENSVCKHFSSETLVMHKLSSEQQTKNNFGLPDIIYEDISDGEVQPDVESFKETVCSFNCNSKPTKRSQLERSHSNSFEVQTLSKLSLEQQTEDSHGLFGTVYEDLSDEEIQLAEESAMYREVHICAGHSELKIENHKVLSTNTIYENVSDDEIQPNGKYLLCRDYSCAGNSELKAENRQGLSNNTIYENVSDEEIQPEKNTTKLLGDTEQSAPWLFSVPPQHGEKGGTVRVAAKNSECLQMESSPIPTVISVRSDSVPSKRVVERTLTVPLLSWKEVSFDLRQRDSLNSISGKNETEHKKMVNPVKDQVYGSDARSGISSLEEATGNADGSLHSRSTQRVTPHGQSSVQETENAFSCNNPDNRSHGHREEGWQTKEKQPFLISPEKLQAFRNALKGSEKFRPKWPQSDTDLSHDDEEKMREPDIVKERRLISHTGQEQGHLAITEHNVEVEMEELEESEVFQMDIDAENRYTPPGSVVHTNIPEFSVPGEPCGNQNWVTPAKHSEHSATAAGMRQVLTNVQDRCSTSMKSVYLETCDELSHHTRRQGSSESSSSSPPVLEPIYGKESKQPELVKLHQMGTQNTTITLSKEASSLSVLPRQGNRRFSKSSEEAVCHSNSLDSSRHQDQHDTLDATAQNSRNTQEPVSAKLKEKSVTALPHPFDASKHCADHERVDFFDDIYNGG